MPIDPHDPEVARFVDELGTIVASGGLPRMAGRMLAWLMVCEPPQQSSAQLQEALGVSKGAISTTTRLLEQIGLAERVHVRGERAVHFRVKAGVWSGLLAAKMQAITMMREVADRGLELQEASGSHPERLREMRDVYAIYERELPKIQKVVEKQMERK